MPRLNPYFARSSEGATLSAIRPDCFWPELLGECERSLSEARALLAGFGELADLAVDADALAREVAARLTDPILAPSVGLDERNLEYLSSAFVKHARQFKPSAEERAFSRATAANQRVRQAQGTPMPSMLGRLGAMGQAMRRRSQDPVAGAAGGA